MSKFTTVKIKADVKKSLDYIARMLKKKQSETLEAVLKPIESVISQIEKRGYRSVNIKVAEHPFRTMIIIEVHPSEVVKA